jgi:uncharacterized protein (DUF305 family)
VLEALASAFQTTLTRERLCLMRAHHLNQIGAAAQERTNTHPKGQPKMTTSEQLPPNRPQLEASPETRDSEAPSPEPTGFSLRQLIIASLAFVVLGAGIGLTVGDRIQSRNQETKATAIDSGFLNDMLAHHDQAVEMSLMVLNNNTVSPIVRGFATEIIMFQRWEIGLMEARLTALGEEPAELSGRNAMGWMGMSTPVESMQGMASEAELESLKQAQGLDADRIFLTLMRAHHKGGVHMAEYALANASDTEVQGLAARMAYNQKLEVTEYTSTLARMSKTVLEPAS